MKVFAAALALLASSSASAGTESTKLRAQQDDTTARDLAVGGVAGSPNAAVPPFEQLEGTYLGSSTASINGRVLFGGCTKNLADCPAGGFYETGSSCEVRCQQNTCSGAMIDFAVSDIRASGTLADVTVTVMGGMSKDGSSCGGGGEGLPIPYECMATAGGGSVGFTCENVPFSVPGAPGVIPEAVLTVKATLTPGGNINWSAFALNPQSGAPNAGELNAPEGTSLRTGNIQGMKMDGGEMHMHGWTCTHAIG